MKILLALLLGIIIGAGALWYYTSNLGKPTVQSTGQQIESATKSARDAIQEKLRSWNLQPQDIKDELARTGRVVRQKAREAGQAIADATVDARITATIKGKLVADPDLSALTISVNTTAGVVTLSGTVASHEDIGKAILLAMDTDGVRQAISTLQVKKD